MAGSRLLIFIFIAMATYPVLAERRLRVYARDNKERTGVRKRWGKK
jgi:hypothetical protein